MTSNSMLDSEGTEGVCGLSVCEQTTRVAAIAAISHNAIPPGVHVLLTRMKRPIVAVLQPN